MLQKIGVFCALMAIIAWPVAGGNGHMLHGFGPVNSSMAGAGAGLWIDPAGALMFNPALLASCEGTQITIATEFFKDDITIEVVLNDRGGGTLPGRNAGDVGITKPPNEVGVLPTIGWAMHKPGSKWGVGFGLVAVAGFRTDYPTDSDSILFANPRDGGFGRIFTDYRVTRIPIAFAYQATDKLALGFSLNAYLGQLAIAPLPFVEFDPGVPADPDVGPANPPGAGSPQGTRFYAEGANLVSEYAFAVQLGFLYTVSPALSIGGSYTSEQDYDDYSWVATFASPDLANFLDDRPRLLYDLDGPWNVTLGAGWQPSPTTEVALDVMYIEYTGVSGFGSPGGVVYDPATDGPAPWIPGVDPEPDPGTTPGPGGNVFPFGWNDVWVYKIGVQWQASPTWTLRAGFNYSSNPIQGEKVLSATGAPAMFREHYTVGVGYQVTPQFRLDGSFYVVPEESATGPYPNLYDQSLGTLTESNGLTGALFGFNWKF